MKLFLEQSVDKKEYEVPMMDIYRFNYEKDVIRTSPGNESNDNDFDAGELGQF